MDLITKRKRMVDVFGPAQAAEAMIAIDAYEQALFLEEGEPYPEFRSESSMYALGLMREVLASYGYDESSHFETYIQKWTAHQRGEEDKGVTTERQSYAPVDLGSAFHLGRLYYPVQTLLKTYIGRGSVRREAEKVDIVVVRSDRTLQMIEQSIDENGKPSGIYRLTDGTLLQKKPSASAHATWSWEYIQRYLSRDYINVPLVELASKTFRHLRARVWLPNDADYWLLTFAAITSYVQPVFDAVPLILLHGQPGTGKSELGTAMTEVSCNAVMIGQTSAPTMLRLMDECKGLVIIDDLESIGVKSGASGKEKFSEMVQVLKVSYKKSSATKIITNTRRKTEVMNFFGIKIVSNTKGVDAILGSRMFHISTQNIGGEQLDEFLSREPLSSKELYELRNQLHIWAFDHSQDVDKLYQEIVSGSTARDEEIAAPLIVIAKLCGLKSAEETLLESLTAQKKKKLVFRTPEHALEHVMEKMVNDGYQTFALIEISLRLRALLGLSGFKNNDRPTWAKSEWISKKLRATGWISEELKRKNLFGYQTKVFRISDSKRIEKGTIGQTKVPPFAFCQGCRDCPNKTLACDILPYRVKKEQL